MSFGGVHPAEWLFPPLALNHALVNTVAPINTPGSSAARKESAARDAAQKENMRQVLSEQRARDVAEQSKPFTPDQELASRQRLASASDFLTGKKRSLGTLGAA